VLRSLDSCPTDADSALPLTDHADARARWLNAEALAALGPTPKRSRVGDVAPDASGFDVASMAPAYLSRAAIHAERGETQLSVQTWRTGRHTWRGAGPVLEPRVREA